MDLKNAKDSTSRGSLIVVYPLPRLTKVRLNKTHGAWHTENYLSSMVPIHSGLKPDALGTRLRIICILSNFQLGLIL
jgi:hypothetical protein